MVSCMRRSLFLAAVLYTANLTGTTANPNADDASRDLWDTDCNGHRELTWGHWTDAPTGTPCDDGLPHDYHNGAHRGLTYTTECPSVQLFLAPDGNCDNTQYYKKNESDKLHLPGYLFLDGSKLDTGGWEIFKEFDASTSVTYTTDSEKYPAVCFRTTSWITFKGFEINGKYINATSYKSYLEKSMEGGSAPFPQFGGIGYIADGEWLKYDVGYLKKGTYKVKYYLSRLKASCTNPPLPPCRTWVPTAPPTKCNIPATPVPTLPATTVLPTAPPTPAVIATSPPTPDGTRLNGCPAYCIYTDDAGISVSGICTDFDYTGSKIDVGRSMCGSDDCTATCWIDFMAPGLCARTCSEAADTCADPNSTQPVECSGKAQCACIPVDDGASCVTAQTSMFYDVCSNGNPDGCQENLCGANSSPFEGMACCPVAYKF